MNLGLSTALDNGLLPGRGQAIIWTNAGILLIWTLGTNFREILSKIHTFSFKKIHLKISSAKWRPFCLGLNELKSNLSLQNMSGASSCRRTPFCVPLLTAEVTGPGQHGRKASWWEKTSSRHSVENAQKRWGPILKSRQSFRHNDSLYNSLREICRSSTGLGSSKVLVLGTWYLMQNLEYLVLTCTWHFEIQKYLVLTCTWRQSTWYLSKYFQVLLSN